MNCPCCDYEVSAVPRKEMVACLGCRRPLTVHPEGRLELSPLYWARGWVRFTRHPRQPGKSTEFVTYDTDTSRALMTRYFQPK